MMAMDKRTLLEMLDAIGAVRNCPTMEQAVAEYERIKRVIIIPCFVDPDDYERMCIWAAEFVNL